MYKLLLTIFAILLSLVSLSSYSQDQFKISSTSFTNGNAIPVEYTCNGNNTSPEIHWSNLPDKTQTLALIVSDPDAPRGIFYHWVIYNIPSSETSIPEGGPIPQGATVGLNSNNKPQYYSLCPPNGATHHYVFTLYAIDTNLHLSTVGNNANALIGSIQGHVVGTTQLIGTYGKNTN